MAVTIEDVAKEAGVSIATVSRVINGTKAVSPKTEQRVLQAIEHLQFSPNRFAKGLSSNRSDIIGVIVTDISNWVIAAVIKGINSVCAEHGYTLMVCESGGDPERERQLLQQLREQKAAGALFAGLNVTTESTEEMLEQGYPIVLVTQEASDGKHQLTTVIHDNVAAVVDAVNFLYANGHRKIAFIGGLKNDYSSNIKRTEGFLKAAAELNLTVPESYIVNGDFNYDSGYACMQKLYEENTVLPSAVMVCSDMMAVGAIACADHLGLKVPDDLSVMGFDDYEVARYYRPSLSTVRIPYFEEGRQAAEELFSMIDAGVQTTGTIKYVKHQVIRRMSVRDINR
ncbi:MAG: LacI family DNA-binding transcriptional regulator [Lachnospiraceae bacterium]|nr:LacI family DNA-binding transcriptional regulator [Lachnospiraceae bacterium]